MPLLPKFAIVSATAVRAHALAAALPEQEATAPHWPWWLRILAVIGALLFVRLVARTMRRNASGQGHDPAPNVADNNPSDPR
jgi:hypothetical protein